MDFSSDSSPSTINIPALPPRYFPPSRHHLTPSLALPRSSHMTLPYCKRPQGSLISSTPHPALSPPKPKAPRRKPDLTSAAITATPPCTECGKRFSSWKALFGHMRCHPERRWRGINPPPHLRRPSPPDQYLTAEEHEVAASLLLLSRSTTRGATDERGSIWQQTCGKGGRHGCDVCSRCFSSGQALGGHKRSHFDMDSQELGGPSVVRPSSRSYILDLNLPPPPESSDSKNPTDVLDLKLGI